MIEFSTPAWIGLAVTAGIGVLAILNSVATVIRNQTHVHDTRVKVNTLRKDYLDRLRESDEDEVIDVSPEEGEFDILPDGPAAQAQTPAPGKQAA